jgi:hypothetical protein
VTTLEAIEARDADLQKRCDNIRVPFGAENVSRASLDRRYLLSLVREMEGALRVWVAYFDEDEDTDAGEIAAYRTARKRTDEALARLSEPDQEEQ